MTALTPEGIDVTYSHFTAEENQEPPLSKQKDQLVCLLQKAIILHSTRRSDRETYSKKVLKEFQDRLKEQNQPCVCRASGRVAMIS